MVSSQTYQCVYTVLIYWTHTFCFSFEFALILVVSVSSLQRNRNNRRIGLSYCFFYLDKYVYFIFYIHMWERVGRDAKESTHAILGASKSKIDSAGQQAGNWGRNFVFDSLETEFLLLKTLFLVPEIFFLFQKSFHFVFPCLRNLVYAFLGC